MRIKINGAVVVDGTEVIVSDTDDLLKTNEIFRQSKNILDRFKDIDTIEITRIKEK